MEDQPPNVAAVLVVLLLAEADLPRPSATTDHDDGRDCNKRAGRRSKPAAPATTAHARSSQGRGRRGGTAAAHQPAPQSFESSSQSYKPTQQSRSQEY